MKLQLPRQAGGFILSAVIVACRAFQPNAEPMWHWSKFSWVLMTLPCAWPIWFMLICYLAAGISSALLFLEKIAANRD